MICQDRLGTNARNIGETMRGVFDLHTAGVIIIIIIIRDSLLKPDVTFRHRNGVRRGLRPRPCRKRSVSLKFSFHLSGACLGKMIGINLQWRVHQGVFRAPIGLCGYSVKLTPFCKNSALFGVLSLRLSRACLAKFMHFVHFISNDVK
jgi:hypothetical protein